MLDTEFFKSLDSKQYGSVIAVLFRKSQEEIGGPEAPCVRFYLKPEGCDDVCESIEQFDTSDQAEHFLSNLSDKNIDIKLSSFTEFFNSVKGNRVIN